MSLCTFQSFVVCLSSVEIMVFLPAEGCDCAGGGVLLWCCCVVVVFFSDGVTLLLFTDISFSLPSSCCGSESVMDVYVTLSSVCPSVSLQPSEKCGVLNVTKITEHGKKVR